jgi:TolA-binding protein
MTPAMCRKVQRAIARDGAEPESVAVMAHHLRGCAECRTAESTRARVRASLLALDDVLDDLTRARVLARVLERQRRYAGGAPSSATEATTKIRVGWTLAISAMMVLAAVAALRTRGAGVARPVGSFALEPYAVHGTGAAGPSRLDRGGLDRVELPAHASMRARLGPHADFVLVGPLELAIPGGASDRRATVELRRGTLIGDFDGSSGGSLRIVTADATVDIVGTRFLVETSSERTRVAVEHGRVRVESGGRVRLVGALQEWLTDGPGVGPLDATAAALFERARRGELEELGASVDPAAPIAPAEPRASVAAARTEAQAGPGRHVLKRARTIAPAPARNVAFRVEAAPADAGALPASSASLSSPRRELSGAGTGDQAPAVTPASPVAATAVDPPPAVAPAAPVPSRAPASEEQPRETASSLYRRAEEALRRRDDDEGKKLLDQLVRSFPSGPTTDSARYELALMAERAGQRAEALAQTREILRTGGHGPFVEPAQFLRCRIYLVEDRGAAAACLTRFVGAFPRSPHDEAALRSLIELARQSGHCDDVGRFAQAYLQRHPTAPFAAEATRARSACAR